MILYHGTSAYFDVVDLSKSKRRLDFGAGFYTTTDINQAREIAISGKRSRMSLGDYSPKAFVYSFKFDGKLEQYLRVHKFNGASIAWLDYILYNRMPDKHHNNLGDNIDVVIGKIADAKVKSIISDFESTRDFSDVAKKKLIVRLKTEIYTDQYVFKSVKSVNFLNQMCICKRQEVF